MRLPPLSADTTRWTAISAGSVWRCECIPILRVLVSFTNGRSALNGMVLGEGTPADDPVQAIKDVYAKGGPKDGDEFLKPIIVGGNERRLKGT